jgi:two-component sensor histidine kinase
MIYSDIGACFPKYVNFKCPHTLGLQLVNALAEQFNGIIKLDKGEETKFTIKFNNKGLMEQEYRKAI